jgi:hypothetical protein
VQFRSVTILRANPKPNLPAPLLRTKVDRAHQLRTQLPAAADHVAAAVVDPTVAAVVVDRTAAADAAAITAKLQFS